MISAIIICFFVIALCIYLLIGFCAKVIITNESIRLRNKPFFKLQEVNLEYVQAIYVVSDWRGHTHIIFSHECLDAERCQKLANRCGLGMFLIIQQKVVFPITTGDIQGVLEILNNCFPIVYVP